MESYLYLWSGYFSSWKKYYFILDDNSLLYCSNKGEQVEGRISLQLINIHIPVDNPVCFNIHTGVQVLYLKAMSIDEKVRWTKKIQQIIKNRDKSGVGQLKDQLNFRDRRQSLLKRFDQFIKQLWIAHAKLQGAIQNIAQKQFNKNSHLSTFDSLVDQLKRSASVFKFKATQITKHLQDMYKNLNNSKKNKIKSFLDEDEQSDQNQTQFLSFQEPSRNLFNRISRNSGQQQFNKFQKRSNLTQLQLKPKFSYTDMEEQAHSKVKSTPIKELYTTQNSIKSKLLKQNEVFKKIASSFSNHRQRDSLPIKFTPQAKFPIFNTLSGALGQNLTKIAFPVTINQPLSMLQRGCQQLYYAQLLKIANQSKDPLQKMAYVVAFIVSTYSLADGRLKKPFNPLLGQTFVYDDPERQFFYFGEQVSHHPPISAMYCRSQNFQYVANSCSDLTFTGKSLKLLPSSKSLIILNNQEDRYWFNKCTVSINNIIFGNTYIQTTGEIQVKCDKFKTNATITFNQKSWRKEQYSIEGKIKYADKELQIFGKWNKQFGIKDKSGKQRVIWKRNHLNIPDQYGFNNYTLQLNHLSTTILKEIPPTDSRLRPDQKILEYRDLDLAARQKHRLEQSQRKRKKANDEIHKQHQIIWFKKNQQNNQQIYWFLNEKYQNQRFKDQSWANCLDIFN